MRTFVLILYMKPRLHSLPISSDSSFLYKSMDCPYFNVPWHFHKEFELCLITKSNGTRFIGDHVGNFEAGDLMLIGSNIPHLYRNSETYYRDRSKLTAGSIFVHFSNDFLGTPFSELPEMEIVNKLLKKSSLALEIHGKAKGFVTAKLNEMKRLNPPEKLISLLEILVHLSQSRDLKPLLSIGFTAAMGGDTERINSVFEFIMKNYTKEIYIQEIASRLNMSVPSFSRYFKHHARKTFSDYVTEIRIGHARRLIMENNLNISEISFQSGFENLSNFYRHFKTVSKITPKEYRNRFLSTAS
jgi:AraC-like DNA-binding protein